MKEQAKLLRSNGHTLTEISQQLGAIPKNTIQGWVADIALTTHQRARIRQKILNAGAQGRPLAVRVRAEQQERWKQGIQKRVQHLGILPWHDETIGRLTCGVLYLCEGGKYPSARQVTFGNTDPRVIRAFLHLLRKYFHIDERKLRCRISYRWDQHHDELKHYWSQITGIPLDKFYRSRPDARTRNKPTKRPAYRGVCVLHYASTELQLELQLTGESILGKDDGAEGDRTPDLLDAIEVRSQLRYCPATQTT